MTDIEQKALALVNEVSDNKHTDARSIHEVYSAVALSTALCRAIEQHEAFRQEVSDVVEQALSFGDVESLRRKGVLSRFIIPAPKPDPLVEVLKDLSWDEETAAEEWAGDIRKALAARGLEIREKNDD